MPSAVSSPSSSSLRSVITLLRGTFCAGKLSSFLQNFYQRIQRRRGGGKANIALARKFLGVIYHTLKNDWVFEDFPTSS